MALHTLLLSSLLSLAGAGCDKPPRAAQAGPYEVCSWGSIGEPCGHGPTECSPVATNVMVGFCSQPCEADADCFEAPDHGPVVCAQFYDGRRCAVRCSEEGDCPEGNSCFTFERFDGSFVSLCQPESE